MAKEKAGSLLNSIKTQIQNSGNSKGALFFVKSGDKGRIRFLEDFENGRKITFHDSFEKGINVPCQKHFGKKCKFCNDESLRTRDFYAWSVFNHDTKKVQVFMYPVNSFSPLPALVNMYEVYGTITDRDYSISREGKGTSTQYGLVPLDKVKFKNAKAKPLSESKFLEILEKAFDASPKSSGGDDDEDETTTDEELQEALEELDMDELKEMAQELGVSAKALKKCKSEDALIELILTEADEEEIKDYLEEHDSDDDSDDDDDDEDSDDDEDDEDDDDDDEEENDYSEMSLKELRAEAKSRGIKITKSMDEDDIIELLEENDEE